MRRHLFRTLAVVLLSSALSTAHASPAVTSERLEFPVTLPDGSACTVVGYLYYEGSYRDRPLQLAIHGATYNHTYWDFPSVNGRDYSYARFMALRGHAVLALDQVGAGESCHPAAAASGFAVTLYDTAAAITQVATAMRSGANPLGYGFRRLVLVGHSAGSINAIYVQATAHVADALVVTGARHLVPPLAAPPGLFDLVTALLPFPYFTLPDAVRTALFHYPAGEDADVIARDNASADVWTNGQLVTTFFSFLDPSIDRVGEVKGPALVQLGEFDALFPAGSPEIEEALWTSTKVKVRTLPDVGHTFNLQLDRERGWRRIDEWIREQLTPND